MRMLRAATGSTNMQNVLHRNRRSVSIENEAVRLTITVEGANVAEILHKPTGVNPLWTPPWPSIEPSAYAGAAHPEYGTSDEAPILSGIMGHSVCLDTYGTPSPEEFLAGVPVHGEASVIPFKVECNSTSVSLRGVLPKSQLEFVRQIRLAPNGSVIHFEESIIDLCHSDRPIAWTRHVVVGPPFLECGKTEFRTPVTRSRVIDSDFTQGRGLQKSGAEFQGFLCPRKDTGFIDLRVLPDEAVSGGFTTHLLDTSKDQTFFVAWSGTSKLAFGYVWNRRDFPWLCRWEENHLRADPPWNGRTLACGMEFGFRPHWSHEEKWFKEALYSACQPIAGFLQKLL